MANKIQAQKCHTPQSVAQEKGLDSLYKIPIYQRLFEWKGDNVIRLMDDLYNSFKFRGSDSDYFIGMLTSTKGRELVDGQQRFTVLMLIGIAIRNLSVPEDISEDWLSFLMLDSDHLRVHYEARDEDNEYLKDRITNAEPKEYINYRMSEGISAIDKYLRGIEADELNDFCRYIFAHLSLFIATLPDNYRNQALNKYFESMNSTGKNLDNHEILKVDLLKKLPDSCNKEHYTRLWNAIADMDKPIIRKRESDGKKEDEVSLNRRAKAAITESAAFYDDKMIESIFEQSLVNDLSSKANEKSSDQAPAPIMTIAYKPEDEPRKPEDYKTPGNFRSVLTFTEFLLQILYVLIKTGKINPKEEIQPSKFFDPNNLIDTFKLLTESDKGSIKMFFAALLHYRLVYDYYCIKLSSLSDGNVLMMRTDMSKDESVDENKLRLQMFESMLYVSSTTLTYYFWVPELLITASNNPDISFEELLNVLKQKDNSLRKVTDLDSPSKKMDFDHIDRYWFWRLDYYIWERRDELFESSEYLYRFKRFRELVESYVFRRNRSIEHVSPQHPEIEPPLENLNHFGNLVMISSGLNSKLSNSTYRVKKAHVEDCLSKKSIESLSMILLYSDKDEWTDSDIEERQKKMLKILKESFAS